MTVSHSRRRFLKQGTAMAGGFALSVVSKGALAQGKTKVRFSGFNNSLHTNGNTTMATKVKTDLKTERPTYASDFIKADVEQAVFLGNPILDNLVTSMVAVCSELWATKRRTMVIERLLAEKGITEEMIEGI